MDHHVANVRAPRCGLLLRLSPLLAVDISDSEQLLVDPSQHVETATQRPKVALVLGAGGVRGTAHAAVIQVFQRAGIPMDAVVGASVGSMYGLGLAAGTPIDNIVRSALNGTPFELFRFYSGRLRPEGRNRISRMLFDAGFGKNFDDLDLPFAVMATDMETHEIVALNSGPVLPAVQASIAIPFIARPVRVEGRYYMDGGLLGTAPVRVAHELGADVVIAVRLGFNYAAPRYLRSRPWTRPVLQRLGKQRAELKGHLRDQIRFGCRLYANSYSPPLPAGDADVTIWPDFEGISPNSLAGSRFCFEQGRKAAEEALPTVRRVLEERNPARASA